MLPIHHRRDQPLARESKDRTLLGNRHYFLERGTTPPTLYETKFNNAGPGKWVKLKYGRSSEGRTPPFASVKKGASQVKMTPDLTLMDVKRCFPLEVSVPRALLTFSCEGKKGES